MSVLELKGGIFDIVAKINDEELLSQLYKLTTEVVNENLEKTDYWEELAPEERERLQEALEASYNEGNLLSAGAAVKQFSKWLK